MTTPIANIPTLSKKDIMRFWSKVQKKRSNECWLWLGSKSSFGYGLFFFKRTRIAHRISWQIHYGPIPKRMLVLHNCPTGDNPSCVNPKHLWLGTNLDNSRDCIAKGRHAYGIRCGVYTHPEAYVNNRPRGEEQPLSKLTINQVNKIRKKHATGKYTQIELAREHKVHQCTISRIVGRLRWGHV